MNPARDERWNACGERFNQREAKIFVMRQQREDRCAGDQPLALGSADPAREGDAVRRIGPRGIRFAWFAPGGVRSGRIGLGGALDDLHADGLLGHGTGWLFGNEAWGLPADVRTLADEAVAVPIYGRAESLNLAAAAAVCLYASAAAQR